MPSIKEILMPLDGNTYSLFDLDKAIDGIYLQYLEYVPSDFRASDLFDIAFRRGWIKHDGEKYFVKISD